jgi:hypothetical protein
MERETLAIVAVRSFFVAGVAVERGARVELHAPAALALIASGKARAAPAESRAAGAPPETAQAAEAATSETRGRRRKGTGPSDEG